MADLGLQLDDFTATARAWLDEHAEKKPVAADGGDIIWGQGDFDVSVFHALTFDEEKALLDQAQEWSRLKAKEGYHAITWPTEYGGLGLGKQYGRAFHRLEAQYITPSRHETFGVTTGLIAPTVRAFGTEEQKNELVAALLRPDFLCCQLFSEPGAGSDLASLACRAELDGEEWRVNGQKVWSSGAQYSEYGELIARSDPDAVKHKGLTAFIIPMDLPGIEIRPIKQMSGGQSFCEVFFNDVIIPDSMRLGPEGEGWKVALTTLGFERDHSASGGGGGSQAGGSWKQLLATADHFGLTDDPVIRQRLMEVFIHNRVESYTNRRAADLAKSGTPGPEGSLGKLLWTEGMTLMGDVIGEVLGARLIADSGEWGSFVWNDHVLGAPGYRIAGGSDEVQRNIIGERVLGLPGEPRVDKGIPWKDVPR